MNLNDVVAQKTPPGHWTIGYMAQPIAAPMAFPDILETVQQQLAAKLREKAPHAHITHVHGTAEALGLTHYPAPAETVLAIAIAHEEDATGPVQVLLEGGPAHHRNVLINPHRSVSIEVPVVRLIDGNPHHSKVVYLRSQTSLYRYEYNPPTSRHTIGTRVRYTPNTLAVPRAATVVDIIDNGFYLIEIEGLKGQVTAYDTELLEETP